MVERLELGDMQRLILDGYPQRPESRYALLQIQKGQSRAAREWLRSVLAQVGTADRRDSKEDYRLNLAFTHAGLEALGSKAKGFLAPFREGMTCGARPLILGDTDSSDPGKWRWGQGEGEIHVLLMVFSARGRRDADWSLLTPGLERWALAVELLDGYLQDSMKEHFGFRDGISQPFIEGAETSRGAVADPRNRVKPGEFILGYRNEANVLPTSPYITADDYRDQQLPEEPEQRLPERIMDPQRRDFGRNGTYLVLRQLRQHVEKFHEYLAGQVPGDPSTDPDVKRERTRIAAKMVGRWPSGAPLVKTPDGDRRGFATDNDFGFHERDPYGHACPIGSHIRRSNPRDALVDESRGITPEEALRQSKRHRLLRRGRLYDETASKVNASGRGMLFLCLNANIQDQFEFVQHNWINAPGFGGLEGETDPLVGPRPSGTCPMTIQGAEGTRRIAGLERFVDVVGGAYFFMPGMKALRCLSVLRD
jgi:Dyp-type peroxidase family